MSHTPGQWTVIDKPVDINNVPRVVSPSGGIAVMCINRMMGDPGPSAAELANARLIAAAPDLLEALEAALPVMEQRAPDFNIVNDAIRAAIAKATS